MSEWVRAEVWAVLDRSCSAEADAVLDGVGSWELPVSRSCFGSTSFQHSKPIRCSFRNQIGSAFEKSSVQLSKSVRFGKTSSVQLSKLVRSISVQPPPKSGSLSSSASRVADGASASSPLEVFAALDRATKVSSGSVLECLSHRLLTLDHLEPKARYPMSIRYCLP